MVGPCTTTTSVELASTVEEMWPAFKNAVSLIAQHCPQFIQSCDLLHGDGGPGSIRLVKFGPASGLVTYSKEEIVEVDEEKMVLTYLLLEGDLRKQFKVFKPSISLEKATHIGVEAKESNETSERQHQSVATWTLEYEIEEGMPSPQIELLNEGAKIFFQLLEASVKALQAPPEPTPTPPHPPIKEEPSTPLLA